MTEDELVDLEETLKDVIEARLPGFASAVSDFIEATENGKGNPMLMFHQDAFAADYQQEELGLLGAAIKYAGIFGVPIMIIGENGATIDRN